MTRNRICFIRLGPMGKELTGDVIIANTVAHA